MLKENYTERGKQVSDAINEILEHTFKVLDSKPMLNPADACFVLTQSHAEAIYTIGFASNVPPEELIKGMHEAENIALERMIKGLSEVNDDNDNKD